MSYQRIAPTEAERVARTLELAVTRRLDGLLQSLKQGNQLSVAAAEWPQVFDPLYVNLVALGEAAGSHGPALGYFGRFRRGDDGRVDLKAGGLLPVVTGARVMALRRGVASRATPERLRAAVEVAGGAGEADARHLDDAHGVILKAILEQQILDIARGAKPLVGVSP